MDTVKKDIAKLIIKHLKGEITNRHEKQVLEEWLAAHERNHHFLEELKSYARVEADFELIESINEENAWNNIQELRKRKTAKGLRYYLLRIAVAAIFLGIIGVFLYESRLPSDGLEVRERFVQDKTGKYDNDILPAENAARLILADGSSLPVAHNNVVVSDGVIRLENSEAQIYKQDASSAPTYHTLEVPRASFFKLVLPDGTRVWLNALSQLRFPAAFAATERRVLVEGEAYFEVAKDPKKPFYVDVAGTSVKVLGTHFNINSYSTKVITTLVEGAVEIRAGEQLTQLAAGQEAESNSHGIQTRIVDIAKAVAWKNGEFHFNGDNVASIAKILANWYDLDIRFRGRVNLSKCYSGRIDRSATLTEVLEMLEFVSDLSFELNGKQLTIMEMQNK